MTADDDDYDNVYNNSIHLNYQFNSQLLICYFHSPKAYYKTTQK